MKIKERGLARGRDDEEEEEEEEENGKKGEREEDGVEVDGEGGQ